MKRLVEGEVLWLKKYAGMLTEDEEREFKLIGKMMIEGIEFGFEIPQDINKDLFVKDAYSLAYEFESVAKGVPGGKEFLGKVQNRGPVFVDDWSSVSRSGDSSSTAINFYLNYKAEESDREVLMKILNGIEDRAMALGFKLGEYKYETSKSKEEFDYEHNFKKQWSGRQYKHGGQDISSVRVINIPIEEFPEKDDILDHTVDMNHQSATIIFQLMGIDHEQGENPLGGGNIVMDHGILKKEDIPKYLQNLMRAKNTDLSRYEVQPSSSGGGLRRTVDRSSGVPSIGTSRTAKIMNAGMSKERIVGHIDNMIKLLQKAQKNGLNIQWG